MMMMRRRAETTARLFASTCAGRLGIPSAEEPEYEYEPLDADITKKQPLGGSTFPKDGGSTFSGPSDK